MVEGRVVSVVNTPPLFDKSFNTEELSRCFSLLAPGPHAFLLVLPIGNISPEDGSSLELIKKMFGRKAVDSVVVVFTRGDQLENQTFEKYIEECPGFVKDILKECQGRWHLFNNKDQTSHGRVSGFFLKIDKMLQTNYGLTKEILELERKQEQTKLRLEKTVKELTQCKIKLDVRDRQLREKDEAANQERLDRRKEREEEARKRKRQEEAARQEARRRLDEAKRRLDEAERRARAEAEERRRAEKQLERRRQDWDRERKDILERWNQELKQSLGQQSESYKQLQELHFRKRRKWTLIIFVVLLGFLILAYHLFLSRFW